MEAMEVKIEYVTNSFAAAANDEEIEEMQDLLIEDGLVLDPAYWDHIKIFNGGIPMSPYFPGGQIERFLNFSRVLEVAFSIGEVV